MEDKKEAYFFGNQEARTPFFLPNSIQPKLKIGRPNDQYEQETDAMAEEVVGKLSKADQSTPGTEPVSEKGNWQSPVFRSQTGNQIDKREEENEQIQEEEAEVQRRPIFESNADPSEEEIQRKCVECEQEEKVQKKATPTLMTKSSSGEMTATPDFQEELNTTQGKGQPLPDDTRTSMESAFGIDFSGVNIHTDQKATEMSQGLGAQAFTHGADIYFNKGKYEPGSTDGQKLLAHELTHTVQQGGGAVKMDVQLKSGDYEDIAILNRDRSEIQDFTNLYLQFDKGFIPDLFYDTALKNQPDVYLEKTTLVLITGKNETNYSVEVEKEEFGDREYFIPSNFRYEGDFSVVGIAEKRIIQQAEKKHEEGEIENNDYTGYKIRLKTGAVPIQLYADPELTVEVGDSVKPEEELILYDRVGTAYQTFDENRKKRYLTTNLNPIHFSISGSTPIRRTKEANQDKAKLTNLTGYVIKLKAGGVKSFPYPSVEVDYQVVPLPAGLSLFIEDKIRDWYQVELEYNLFDEAKLVKRFIPANLKPDHFDVVAAAYHSATANVVDKNINQIIDEIFGTQYQALDESRYRDVSINYALVNTILQGLSAYKADSEEMVISAQLSDNDLFGMRGEHKALIINKLMEEDDDRHKEEILRIIKNTDPREVKFLKQYLGDDFNLYEDLYGYFDSTDSKRELAQALERIMGSEGDASKLNKLRKLIREKDSGIDTVLEYTTLSELKQLTFDERKEAMRLLLEGSWSYMDDDDEQSLLNLILSTPGGDLPKLKKLIHPIYSSYEFQSIGIKAKESIEREANTGENYYEKIVNKLEVDTVIAAFYEFIGSGFRDKEEKDSEEATGEEAKDEHDIDYVKLDQFITYLDDEDDDALEFARYLNPTEVKLLPGIHAVKLIRLLLQETVNGPEEEAIYVNLFFNASDEAKVKIAEYLNNFQFFYLGLVDAAIDNEPYKSEYKKALNGVLDTYKDLMDEIRALLPSRTGFFTDNTLEKLVPLLSLEAMEGFKPAERVKLILTLMGDYNTLVSIFGGPVLTLVEAENETEGIINLIKTAPEDDKKLIKHYLVKFGIDKKLVETSWVWDEYEVIETMGTLSPGVEDGGDLANKKQEIDDAIAEDDRVKIFEAIAALTFSQAGRLTFEERLKYIKEAVSRWRVGYVGEPAILKLIQSCPPEDGLKLYEAMMAKSGDLYDQLHSSLDGESFNTLHAALRQLPFEYKIKQEGGAEEYTKEAVKMKDRGLQHPKVLPWGSPNSRNHDVSMVEAKKEPAKGETDDGGEAVGRVKVKFHLIGNKENLSAFIANHSSTEGFSSEYVEAANKKESYYLINMVFDADEFIGVRMYDYSKFLDSYFVKQAANEQYFADAGGDIRVMPAINLFELEVEDNRKLVSDLLTVLELVLIFAGGIGIATKAIRGVVAIIEIALAAITFAVNLFSEELSKTAEGRQFLMLMNTADAAFGLPGLAVSIYRGFGKYVRKAWNLAKGTATLGPEALQTLQRWVDRLSDQEELFAKLFKGDFDLDGLSREINNIPGISNSHKKALIDLAKQRSKFKSVDDFIAFVMGEKKATEAIREGTKALLSDAPEEVADIINTEGRAEAALSMSEDAIKKVDEFLKNAKAKKTAEKIRKLLKDQPDPATTTMVYLAIHVSSNDTRLAGRILDAFGNNSKVLGELLNSTRKFEDIQTFVKASLKKLDNLEAEEALQFARDFARMDASILPDEVFNTLANKLFNRAKRLGYDELYWLRKHLPKLDDAARQKLLQRLSTTDRKVGEFIDTIRLATKEGDIDGINDFLKGLKKDKTILEQFPDFKRKSPREQKLSLLEGTESKLAEKIRDKSLGLPKEVEAKLNNLLDNTDLIGDTTRLDDARGKVVKAINKLLGENLDIQKIRKLDEMGVPIQQGSRGSIFEHWLIKNYEYPPGTKIALNRKKLFRGVKGKSDTAKNIQIDGWHEKGRVLLGVEAKHIKGILSGEQIEQLKRYQELLMKPGKYSGGEYDKIFISYVFSTKDAALKNQNLIRQHLGRNAAVLYVDEFGKIVSV